MHFQQVEAGRQLRNAAILHWLRNVRGTLGWLGPRCRWRLRERGYSKDMGPTRISFTHDILSLPIPFPNCITFRALPFFFQFLLKVVSRNWHSCIKFSLLAHVYLRVDSLEHLLDNLCQVKLFRPSCQHPANCLEPEMLRRRLEHIYVVPELKHEVCSRTMTKRAWFQHDCQPVMPSM